MAYSVPASKLIDYPPSAMSAFAVYGFEYIDNLHFVSAPDGFVSNPQEYIAAARERFLRAGWAGDGDIGLIWLPPFVFLGPSQSWLGVVVWHVKQLEDGISWIMSPIELPFHEFAGRIGVFDAAV